MKNTSKQFDEVIAVCKTLFENKLSDYGAAWRILRLPSVTDQIFIKANRIRSLQQGKEKKVDESEEAEFVAIINYSVIALVQLNLGVVDQVDITAENAMNYFDEFTGEAKSLMEKKNHDYGEAWRDMRISSITDLILQKILRVKQIEDNQGVTKVSEGLAANYLDMLNYAVFALILMNEKN